MLVEGAETSEEGDDEEGEGWEAAGLAEDPLTLGSAFAGEEVGAGS